MGMLSFMPWITTRAPIKVNEFGLLPVWLGEGTPPAQRKWFEPSSDARRILGAYWPQWNSQHAIEHATLVRVGDRDVEADLNAEEFDGVFTLQEAIRFAGLSGRRFFDQLGGYCNADTFKLTVQKFEPGKDGVLFNARRRDGNAMRYFAKDYFRAFCDHHVTPIKSLDLDAALTALVLKEMRTDEEFDQAIRAFNRANTDNPDVPESVELVEVMSAFQRLFGTGSKCVKILDALESTLASVTSAAVQPAKPMVAKQLRKSAGTTLRRAWMNELCSLRGSAAHGKDRGPTAWSIKEHLLLASFVFPLLVKLQLAKAGTRQLTAEDKLSLGTFDLYLASENAAASDDDGRGFPLWRWLALREAARRDPSRVGWTVS